MSGIFYIYCFSHVLESHIQYYKNIYGKSSKYVVMRFLHEDTIRTDHSTGIHSRYKNKLIKFIKNGPQFLPFSKKKLLRTYAALHRALRIGQSVWNCNDLFAKAACL
jgi:hypothetical protein